MATPSSSATSPSPPMAYLSHTPVPPPSSSSTSMDPLELENRKKAVQKFLARAEISMVTRALRARLSYASYKATHNIPHVPLRELEAQTQNHSQTASFSRTIAAKRKVAGVNNNHYNNPATQGSNSSGPLRRRGSGAMPPPASTSSPRVHYPTVSASATGNHRDSANSSKNPNPAASLYTSLLAPPPAKHARTIHNASDPPVSPSSRPAASPKLRAARPSTRSIAEGTRGHTKSRHSDKPTSNLGSPDKRKARRASDKGKRKQKVEEVDVDIDGDIDMKAAATLTSLLLHHRPSIAGSTSSPRSSIDGSEAGSAHSYSHFAQTASTTASTSTIDSTYRQQTPPPMQLHPLQTTPHPAPTDNEAADLMLFLATSPSPARPANKDSKDLEAYRALTGGSGPLRSKGRVLFPSSIANTLDLGNTSPSMRTSGLVRGGESSFNSSISSIGTDLGHTGNEMPHGNPISLPTHSRLLPPPPSPMSSPAAVFGMSKDQSPKPSVEFNFNDFINASPSPSRGPAIPVNKSNLGLRADVGRKLFEEEQLRHVMGVHSSAAKRQGERSLGAGIDLLQS
ncbi:hypothetical protein BD779DRAFT_1659810 [Infundibulicybe gibba]|nr:hypothetical protein BD779DRAFT_1659810 [Infundibulicybe gibba]